MSDPGTRHTPATFSPREADQIREQIVTPGAKPACPRCGGDLTMGPPVGGGETIETVWQVLCPACHRSVIIRDLPGPPTDTG